MFKLVTALFFAFVTSFASANPLMDAMKLEDQRRLCAASEESKDTRTLRREVRFLAEAAGLPEGSFTLLIGECEGYASAATTLNTIIISPQLASVPRNERLFVLAHELAHLANSDVKRWTALGDTLAEALPSGEKTTEMMQALSRELELDADKWAAQALRKFNIEPGKAASAFWFRMGILDLPGTGSHPAAKARVAAMEAVKG